jgi:hypothetical protein
MNKKRVLYEKKYWKKDAIIRVTFSVVFIMIGSVLLDTQREISKG